MEKQLLIDDSDVRKLREIKEKLIKLQLYEEGAICRNLEGYLLREIHEQEERKKRKERSEYAIEFASYLLKNFIAIQGEIKGEKFLAYKNINDTSEQPKAYTPSDVHDYFIEHKAAQNFEEKTGWSFNDPSDLSKIRNQFCEKPNPAAGMI